MSEEIQTGVIGTRFLDYMLALNEVEWESWFVF